MTSMILQTASGQQAPPSYLARKPSSRNLPAPLFMDSSEDIPSVHDSLYDAIFTPARLSHQTRSQSDNDSCRAGETGPFCAISRGDEATSKVHTPQQLCIINERKSVGTLKTIPSNTTFQKRIVSLQPAPFGSCGRTARLGQDGIQRRVCFSLDETELRRLHASETSQHPSVLSSGHGRSPERPNQQVPEPVRPPFKPPLRSTTPDGLQAAIRQQMLRGQTPPQHGSSTIGGRLLRLLCSGYANRARRRQPPAQEASHHSQVIEGQHRWRPPNSGHTTPGFGALSRHPFARTPMATPAAKLTAGTREATINREAETVPQLLHSDQGESMQPSSLASPSSALTGRPQARLAKKSALSASQRALTAASSNAILVTPERAQAASAQRSYSLPKKKGILSPLQARGPSLARPRSYPYDTVRTADLINCFPEPPTAQRTSPAVSSLPRDGPVREQQDAQFTATTKQDPDLRQQSPHGILQADTETADDEDDTNRHEVELRHEQVANRYPPISGQVLHHTVRRGRSISFSVRSQRPKRRSPPRTSPAPAGENDTTATDNPSAPDLPSIRGESRARYRLSGTPVYDPDAASLISHDQAVENDGVSHRTTQTDRTRYFSASSQALAQPAIAQVSSQKERAVANGALRYLPASARETPLRSHMESLNALQDEFPIEPVTVTSHGRLCPHRVSELHNNPQRFEGRLFDGAADGGVPIFVSRRGKFQCWKCRARVKLRQLKSCVKTASLRHSCFVGGQGLKTAESYELDGETRLAYPYIGI